MTAIFHRTKPRYFLFTLQSRATSRASNTSQISFPAIFRHAACIDIAPYRGNITRYYAFFSHALGKWNSYVVEREGLSIITNSDRSPEFAPTYKYTYVQTYIRTYMRIHRLAHVNYGLLQIFTQNSELGHRIGRNHWLWSCRAWCMARVTINICILFVRSHVLILRCYHT